MARNRNGKFIKVYLFSEKAFEVYLPYKQAEIINYLWVNRDERITHYNIASEINPMKYRRIPLEEEGAGLDHFCADGKKEIQVCLAKIQKLFLENSESQLRIAYFSPFPFEKHDLPNFANPLLRLSKDIINIEFLNSDVYKEETSDSATN